MSEIMMALGSYRFSIDSAAYQERLQRRPALQFVEAGEESIELSGLIYPHFKGGLEQPDTMRAEASKEQPLLLVDGLGFV